MINVVPAEQLAGAFYNFRCTKDEDIQDFLQSKALKYESRGWRSTYVLANKVKLESNNQLFVDGYFTLSNKVIELSASVSGAKKKKLLNGLKKRDNYMHFILIGQLGKYIDEKSSNQIYGDVSAPEMLDKAFEIIYQVKERVTYNCVLVECKDEPKVQSIYKDYGFKYLHNDAELIQYFKII